MFNNHIYIHTLNKTEFEPIQVNDLNIVCLYINMLVVEMIMKSCVFSNKETHFSE